MKKLLTVVALIVPMLFAGCRSAADSEKKEMDKFVNELMSKMTLEEKLGQLNLPVAGDIVTGQARESNVAEDIRQGRVGGLFNLKGAAQIREIQRIAVEESGFGIALFRWLRYRPQSLMARESTYLAFGTGMWWRAFGCNISTETVSASPHR